MGSHLFPQYLGYKYINPTDCGRMLRKRGLWGCPVKGGMPYFSNLSSSESLTRRRCVLQRKMKN